MLKTLSAGLLAASIFAAPALAANAKIVRANPLDAKAQVTSQPTSKPATTVKPAAKKVHVALRHHRHHHKLVRHVHRAHTAKAAPKAAHLKHG